MEYWLGQSLGIVSFLMGIWCFYQTDDYRLKWIMTALFAVHGCHFYLLDAQVSAILCFVNMTRTFVSIYIRSVYVAFSFVAIALIAGIYNYSNALDILVIAAAVIGTSALFFLSGIAMRVALLVGASLWLINNIAVGSIGGILIETTVIATNIRTILIMLRQQSPAEELSRKAEGAQNNT